MPELSLRSGADRVAPLGPVLLSGRRADRSFARLGATTSLLAPNASGYRAGTAVDELRRTLAAIPGPADVEEQDQAGAVVG